MKSFILITTLFLTSFHTCFSQDFKAVLKKTYLAFDTTQLSSERNDAANKLILIAKKYPEEFSTNYYAAYSRVQLARFETEDAKKDALLDEADGYLKAAIVGLGKKENDETHILAALIANNRISVNPQSRWQKYGKIFDEQLEAAKKIKADNPRIFLLKGISKFFTPKMFGGGKKASLPYFEKATPLFEKQPTDDISKPFWGTSTNQYFINKCKQEDKE